MSKTADQEIDPSSLDLGEQLRIARAKVVAQNKEIEVWKYN